MDLPTTTEMTLPSGKAVLVCAPHRRVVCSQCCVDLKFDLNGGECISSDDEGIFGFDDLLVPRDVSFAQVKNSKLGRQLSALPGQAESTSEPLERDHISQRLYSLRHEDPPWSKVSHRTECSGNFFPTSFFHKEMSTNKPLELFPPGSPRFINQYNPDQVMVFVDGACSLNGTPNAVGGCGFVFKSIDGGSVGFRLEDRGTDGELYPITSDRAELRAALAALKFRSWHREGFKSLVIATDSTYVAQGATDWARGWIENQWRPRRGKSLKNRDLWEALLLKIEKLHDEGFSVSFWRIPREWNTAADLVAKGAVTTCKRQERYTDVYGLAI